MDAGKLQRETPQPVPQDFAENPREGIEKLNCASLRFLEPGGLRVGTALGGAGGPLLFVSLRG